jgi:hypothetical protein
MAWDVVYGTYDSWDDDSSGWDGYTARQVIPASALDYSGDTIRVSMAYYNADWAFAKCYIGHQADSGDDYDFDGNQVQLLFSTNPGATVSSGGLTSDEIAFELDSTKNLIVSFYFDDAAKDTIPINDEQTGYAVPYKSGVDDAATTDATGYTNVAGRQALIEKIEAEAVRTLDESFAMGDTTSANVSYGIALAEGVATTDSLGEWYDETLPESMGMGDAMVMVPHYGEVNAESFAAGDTHEAQIVFPKILTETPMIYETVVAGWIKSATSTAAITDVAEAELELRISEWLNVSGSLTNNWTGTENVTSTLGLFGQSMIAQIFNDEVTSTAAAVEVVTYLHQMISIANSTFAAADTSSSQVTFNPTVAESIAVSGLLSAIHTLNLSISESGAIVDTLGFAWMDTIAETFAIVDAPTIQWVAMHILTESIVATDTAVGLFNFTDTVTETLAVAAALTLQQTLQDSIEEILNFGITIRLDDEVWEAWVLNTNQFHPSVYSGFDFNSYAVYNNQAFGCREDGIYRLDGTTDNGTTINAGIVLPETDFGSMREKRFRKAYFGISGTSPSIRMETDTANVTYTITSSKANIQRNQKGKDWTLKVSGYTDLDFIELVPIILTR